MTQVKQIKTNEGSINMSTTQPTQKTQINQIKTPNLCLFQQKASNCSTISNKNEYEKLVKIASKTDLLIYIKVLLEAYKSLPNIINIIDRIIEKRASTIPMTSIYGNSYYSTYTEMNKMINLGARKDKLLNLYVIIENMLDSLDDKDRKIAVLKFVQKNTTEEIAKETNIAERTIYRQVKKIIEKLGVYMLSQNWDTDFIKKQIGQNEPWLEDLFYRKKHEELKKLKDKEPELE